MTSQRSSIFSMDDDVLDKCPIDSERMKRETEFRKALDEWEKQRKAIIKEYACPRCRYVVANGALLHQLEKHLANKPTLDLFGL